MRTVAGCWILFACYCPELQNLAAFVSSRSLSLGIASLKLLDYWFFVSCDWSDKLLNLRFTDWTIHPTGHSFAR